ncbi:hypothetical protein J6S88_07425 [bacterium]|nr:hypothetical protein [bacterium]
MNFRKFWKIEYTLTAFAIFAIFILLIPTTIQSTRQAALISKWNEKYNRINYMFSVISAHSNENLVGSLENTTADKDELMMLLLQPYLRISANNNHLKRYHNRYMNNSRLQKDDLYYFSDFYYTNDKTIIGIKDLTNIYGEKGPSFMIMLDVNGKLPPNRWGKDVFGINVFNNGNIEPFGKRHSLEQLKSDCSEKGTGVNCSYFYIIGGGFDE